VLSAGAAATELLTLQTLKEHGRKCGVVADINAIPPLGVQGLDSNDDGKEIIPNIFGVGALVIGKLKNKTEAALIRMAAEASKGIFSYKEAYDVAKRILIEKPKEKKTIVAEPTKYWLP
jgi:methylene-tetrahydromethanopterin dehydrogenase